MTADRARVRRAQSIFLNSLTAVFVLLYVAAMTLRVASARTNLEFVNQHWDTPCIDTYVTYRYRRIGAYHGTFYFHDHHRASVLGIPSWHIELPLTGIAAASAVLPIAWLYRRRRAANLFQPGCCPICGYDLRATPTRCPECGTIAAKANA